MVTFKRVTGAMNAVVFCKEHPSYKRDVYDICATNDVGEVRYIVSMSLIASRVP